jgi:RNA polymerase sigma-70 factor (ECF subfamily)
MIAFAQDLLNKAKGSSPTVAELSKTPPPVSDEQLLQRHIDGDSRAFALLVERYRVELFNFLVHFTGDVPLAEDVFQNTFLQVHVSSAAFDMSRRLKPWLFTIAANKARDELRSRRRRQAAPLDAVIASDQEGRGTYADLIPADIPAPDESSMNLETRQTVQKIIADMPENFRTVLLLCYFHEFPYKETARMLDVPVGTIKSRLHAALKHFAKKWQIAAGRQGPGEL